MVVSLLGILKAGGGYVPLDPTFPPDRLAYMVENSKVGALITHRNLDQTLPTLPSTVVRLDLDGDEIAKHPTEVSKAADLHRHHLAYVLYTSGSTGMPKGVAIAHSAIVDFLLSMQREPGFGAEDTLLAVTTLSFDIAGLELYLPLVSGGRVVVASREDAADPRRLMERVRDSGCTMLQATPATWRMLIEAGWKGSPRLRALCGGDAMPPDLAQALLPRCAELWNMYGPTETTVWSTVHRITASEGQAPIGRPIANTQTYVLDAHRGLVPPGVVGELYIGGEGLARGYLHRPDLTRERFVPSPFAPGALLYRTGDLARWRPDGSLDCLGRTDHQVKVRGFRIELGEIEAALRTVTGVREVVVVAERLGTGEPRLVAYWVGEAERQDLYQCARNVLAPYMVPSAYARLGAFPLTPSGKIDRKALPSPDSIQAASTQLLRPRNDREVLVASVWAEVLGVDSVGIDQDFFALGGTSLLAIRARGRLEQEAGVEIPLRAFFEGPTVATIAAGLGAKADPAEPVVVHMGRGEPSQPLLFLLLGIQLYQDLAVALRGIQPVVAMHVPVRYRPGEEASLSIQAIATRYVDQIRKVQPQGPYQLGGYCFGGLVAFEVARQLETSGEMVAKVAILDGFLPSVYVTRPLARLHDLVVRYSRPAAWRPWLDRAPPPTSQAPSSDGLVDLDVTAPELLPLGHRLEEGLRPMRDHVMVARATRQSYRAGVRLPPDLGWSRFAERVFTIDVPSDHVAMLRDPHAGALAARWATVPPAESDSAS